MGQTNVRLFVANLYNSDSWRQRVNNMPDRQVYAIFRRTQAAKEKKLTLPVGKEETKSAVDWPIYEGQQLSIFDYE